MQTAEIINSYVFKNTPAHIAVRQLEKLAQIDNGNPAAIYGAAEINLQEATEQDVANGPYFQAAGAGYLALQKCMAVPETYQAAFRLAQFPAYRRIYAGAEFIDRTTAQKVHNKCLFGMADLAKAVDNPELNVSRSKRSHGVGTLSEMGVTCLLQYYALTADITGCWWPLQAPLKDDIGEKLAFKSAPKTGRDINIFTDSGDGTPTLTYPVQVKTISQPFVPYQRGITKISLNGDLAITDAGDTTRQIIRDLRSVYMHDNRSRASQDRLMEQAAIIVDKLEA